MFGDLPECFFSCTVAKNFRHQDVSQWRHLLKLFLPILPGCLKTVTIHFNCNFFNRLENYDRIWEWQAGKSATNIFLIAISSNTLTRHGIRMLPCNVMWASLQFIRRLLSLVLINKSHPIVEKWSAATDWIIRIQANNTLYDRKHKSNEP